MSYSKLGSVSIAFLLLVNSLVLAEDKLTRLTIKPNKNLVGEVLSKTDKEIQFKDLKTGTTLTILRSKIESIGPADSEAYVIGYAGIANYLSWKISKHPTSTTQRGKVAAVDSGFIYVNLGSKNGLKVGQSFTVFSDGEDITDPDTGEVIGSTKQKIAELKVVKVEKKMSMFARTDGIENRIEIGSEVVSKNKTISVLPFFHAQGMESLEGRKLSEEVLTALTKFDSLTIVERRLLAGVFQELGIQQTIAFDDETAIRIGRLLGASSLVTGTVSPMPSSRSAYFFD